MPPRAPTPFARRVRALVRRIPPGRALSYGGVAALLGHPRAARAVGNTLASLPDDSDVPWWRVVDARGRVAPRRPDHAAAIQRALLEAEGVTFSAAGTLDWARHGWTPDG